MRCLWCVLLLAVAGCANNPVDDSSTQQPVSQQEAVGDARQRAKAHTELGMLYLRDGRPDVALDEARIALEADSDYSPAHNLMGLVRMVLKEDRAAEESFERAHRMAPGDPEININYGWFLCQTGREQRSIPYFVTASKSSLFVQPTKPLTNAGICALRMKDDKGAEDFLLRALRSDPANADARYFLSDISHRAGRHAEARLHLNEMHRLMEPTPDSAWLGLRIERKLGDREAEARYASLLRRRFAGTPPYQKYMQGQYE
ncbi:MAG: type IV pilus biogenesis/stability protein PilW [Rhodocyclaceae bacterium]|nr:type IV pilus biogenesis/stability protein PilW [Rhodocyclaceae bacterium]